MAKKSNDRIILIDADVVSHFIYAGEILTLPSIFKNEIHILDKVYAELERFPNRKKDVDNLLNFNLLKLIPFPENNIDIKKEYAHIKKLMLKGDGESACMAVAKFNNEILASSNLKDIGRYCDMHSIDYLTTMDFLCEAYRNKVFDLTRCNKFITKVLASGNRLPIKKFEDFTCRTITFCK